MIRAAGAHPSGIANIECEAIADARRVGRALRRLGVERRIVTHPRAKTGLKTHVHNAFAKLGITSRAQLPQLMRRSD
jgi:hypothetical protein